MTAATAAQLEAIKGVLRVALTDMVGRGMSLDVAAARAAAALPPLITGKSDERPAERRQRENDEAMAQLEELERQGKGRAAAAILAKRVADDPNDPAEVAARAKHFRRLRQRKAQCAFGAEKRS